MTSLVPVFEKNYFLFICLIVVLLFSADYVSRIHYMSSSRRRLFRHLRFCLLVFIFGRPSSPPPPALRSFFRDTCHQTSSLMYVPRKPDLLIRHTLIMTKVWRILCTLARSSRERFLRLLVFLIVHYACLSQWVTIIFSTFLLSWKKIFLYRAPLC